MYNPNIQTSQPVQNPNAQRQRLHCPQCKSHNITITTESSVDGAVTTHSSNGRYSSTRVSNTHRNFWVCSDCGTKFRNIQNLEEEIKSNKKAIKTCIITTVISFIVSLFFIINIISKPFSVIFFGAMAGFSSIFTIVAFVYIFVYKSRVAKMEAERQYLIENCFN